MPTQTNYDPDTGEPLPKRGLAPWQKLLAVLSLVLGGVGLAVGTSASPSQDAPPTSLTGPDGFQPEGYLPAGGQGEGGTSVEPESGAPLWAPLAAKGGLSFFLAFCIGYALRAAVKVTLLVVGVLALAVFGLQTAGIIESIDWSRAEGFWDDLTANLGTHVESLKGFVSSSLPTAGAGAVGLVAGFRRTS